MFRDECRAARVTNSSDASLEESFDSGRKKPQSSMISEQGIINNNNVTADDGDGAKQQNVDDSNENIKQEENGSKGGLNEDTNFEKNKSEAQTSQADAALTGAANLPLSQPNQLKQKTAGLLQQHQHQHQQQETKTASQTEEEKTISGTQGGIPTKEKKLDHDDDEKRSLCARVIAAQNPPTSLSQQKQSLQRYRKAERNTATTAATTSMMTPLQQQQIHAEQLQQLEKVGKATFQANLDHRQDEQIVGAVAVHLDSSFTTPPATTGKRAAIPTAINSSRSIHPVAAATLIQEENEEEEEDEATLVIADAVLSPPQKQKVRSKQAPLEIERVLMDETRDGNSDHLHCSVMTAATSSMPSEHGFDGEAPSSSMRQSVQTHLPLVEASPMKSSADDLRGLLFNNKKVQLCILLLVLATIGVTLGVAFGINNAKSRHGDDNDLVVGGSGAAVSESPSLSPSSSSPASVSDQREAFLSMLPDFTLESLKDPSSVQSAVVQWLWNDDLEYVLTLSDARRIQRFVMATVAMSTSNQPPEVLQQYGWLVVGVSECGWSSNFATGLVCDADEKYQVIDVEGFDLTGTIPPEIMLTIDATVIDMSQSSIRGSIPTQIGHLTNLQRLSLSESSLSGSIPSEISEMASLESLELFENRLTGTIPSSVSNLTKLRTFAVGSNLLTGAIPTEICQIPRLLNLGLQNNHLSGTVPTSLGRMTSLLTAQFDRNRFTGTIITEFGSLFLLDDLLLHNNLFVGTIPTELGRSRFVRMLTLHRNELEGTVPDEICELKSLRLELLTHDCEHVLCSCNCTCITDDQDFAPIDLGYGL